MMASMDKMRRTFLNITSTVELIKIGIGLPVLVFNVIFDNISVSLRRSDLLVVETGENHRPDTSH
jgi:acyl CoA:acetate/3-ketoacid CoA transferase beta subunit